MRLVLAGVSDQLATALRSRRRQLDRTSSAADAIRLLRRGPAPQLLVVSEMLPGAGDVLAAVEADCRLSALVLAVVVGDRTALAVVLRHRGVPVVGIRGARARVQELARQSRTQSQRGRERLLSLSKACTASARRHVTRSRRLIAQSHRLCALSKGGCGPRPAEVH